MVKRPAAYETENQKDRSFFRWIFTRWYFWVSLIAYIFLFTPRELVTIDEVLGIILGDIVIFFIVFGLGRGIYLLSTKK